MAQRVPRIFPLAVTVVALAAIAGAAAVFPGIDNTSHPVRPAARAHADYPDLNNYTPPSDEHYVRHYQ
jgi:hypothetical protein